MASSNEEYEGHNGIEASDLASLLCRFEEATSSVKDLIKHAQKQRDKFKKVKIPGNTSGLTFSSPVPPNSNSVGNKRKTDEIIHPASLFLTDSATADLDFIEPPLYQAECMDVVAPIFSSFNTEPSLAPVKSSHSEMTAVSELMVEDWSNISAETVEQSGNPIVFRSIEQSSSTDILENVLPVKSLLQDAELQCDVLTSIDIQKYVPSASLDAFRKNASVLPASHEMYKKCSILSTAGAFEVDSIPASSHRLIHSMQLDQKPVLFSSKTTSGNTTVTLTQQISNLKDNNSNIHLKTSPESEKYIFGQSLNQHLSNDFTKILYESDHSYCLNKLHTVDMHKSECAKGTFRSFTNLRNILQQEQTLVLDNAEQSQCITDAFSDHWSASKSKNTNELVLEESEIFIDSDGNDLFCNDANQLSDTTMCDCSLNSREATVTTTESIKRLPKCLQHAECNIDPICDDTSVFFDKIPSYYTALSIPSKPVTTTIFASTTKAIGSTDHLDFLDAGGPVDEGHYDKVPAHRRCFTNTAKEVEIKLDCLEGQSLASNNMAKQASFEKWSPNESYNLSMQSEQSGVGTLIVTDVQHLNRSVSPFPKIPGRRSRSTTRRSASVSRFSRHSASSMSDCSTCSSCSNSSGCSTCSLLSRSPSSSGSERESSICSDYRTRSRSPGSVEDSRYPAKRMRRTFTPSKVRQTRSRTVSPSEESSWRSKRSKYRKRHNSSLEVKISEKRKVKEEEQVKAMEERRVVYVGKIPNGYSKRQLYQRFQSFGEIKEVKVNFREHGDNYGFVTFAYACDAVAAKEKGNSIAGAIKFDLCFGGRRHFCPDQYSDLDGNREIEEEYAPMSRNVTQELDYSALLKLHSTQQKKKITS